MISVESSRWALILATKPANREFIDNVPPGLYANDYYKWNTFGKLTGSLREAPVG
jgi:hypothetical protein